MKRLSPYSRRDMLRAGGAAAVLAAGHTLIPGGALGRAPLQTTQVPGFFRFHVGAYEVTILSDGNLLLPVAMLATNVPEVTLKAFLKSNLRSTTQRVSHLNAALINTGSELVLIDVGSGLNFQPSAGKLTQNLEASGYSREQVDKIVLTHAHPDHIWGLTDAFAEGPRFPNADYVIAAREWDFWTSKATASKLPAHLQGFAIGAAKHLLPIADKTARVKPDAEVVPGIRLVDTPGHTPGHVSVLIEEGGERLLISADTLTNAHISFEQPGWHPSVDTDPELGVKSRKTLLRMAAATRLMVLCYHLPFPGIGHIAVRGNAYRWIPSAWQWDARG